MEKLFLSAGFYLIKENDRKEYQNKEFVPEKIISLSNCICDTFPNIWAYQWDNNAIKEVEIIALKYGIDTEIMTKLKEEIYRESDKSIGWPNVFYDKKTAIEFYKKFFTKIPDIKLIEVGIEEKYSQKLPKESESNGIINKLREKSKVLPNGKIIGYDVVGYAYGFSCSFLCNGLEKDYKEKFNIILNEIGLFSNYEDAEKVAEYNLRDDVGAEPILWLPWAVIEHELE